MNPQITLLLKFVLLFWILSASYVMIRFAWILLGDFHHWLEGRRGIKRSARLRAEMSVKSLLK